MILRHLVENLKQQNWTAIWIEFVLLVVGVFLGIQVSTGTRIALSACRKRVCSSGFTRTYRKASQVRIAIFVSSSGSLTTRP